MEQNDQPQLPVISKPRLPYHPAVEERYGIDKSDWKALVEAVFPAAQSAESVILALSYCKARKLDPFKKCVHIVPIWNSGLGRNIDTIWSGIGELRTTAFRTKAYAGRDMTTFGPNTTEMWPACAKIPEVTVTFPEFAQVTVYRMIRDQRVQFAGPPVYWLETFASKKGGAPNAMWVKRPRGQLDKCAEAAALRAAFPEELGDQAIADEGGMIYQHGGQADADATPKAGVDGLAGRMKDAKHVESEQSDAEDTNPPVKLGEVPIDLSEPTEPALDDEQDEATQAEAQKQKEALTANTETKPAKKKATGGKRSTSNLFG